VEWPLTEDERATLRAAIDRIVPADDFPSASEAEVDEFIRRLLLADAKRLTLYREGLSRLMNVGFLQAEPERQSALLAEAEGTPFVQSLIQHAIEGYYSDPGNGGNREGVAWSMVGFQVTA